MDGLMDSWFEDLDGALDFCIICNCCQFGFCQASNVELVVNEVSL